MFTDIVLRNQSTYLLSFITIYIATLEKAFLTTSLYWSCMCLFKDFSFSKLSLYFTHLFPMEKLWGAKSGGGMLKCFPLPPHSLISRFTCLCSLKTFDSTWKKNSSAIVVSKECFHSFNVWLSLWVLSVECFNHFRVHNWLALDFSLFQTFVGESSPPKTMITADRPAKNVLWNSPTWISSTFVCFPRQAAKDNLNLKNCRLLIKSTADIFLWKWRSWS